MSSSRQRPERPAQTFSQEAAASSSPASTPAAEADFAELYAVNKSNRRYALELVQQPERGLAAGLELPAFGRMPLQPAYVLQMRVFDAERELGPQEYAEELPFFICSTTLFERDDPAEEGQPEIQRRADVVSKIGAESQQVTTMVGQLVTTALSTTDLQGQSAVYFGFGDLSVRIPGEFRIRFSLGQALPGAPLITHVMSDILSIYEEPEFTMPPNRADTALSRHLRAQGMALFHPIQQQT